MAEPLELRQQLVEEHHLARAVAQLGRQRPRRAGIPRGGLRDEFQPVPAGLLALGLDNAYREYASHATNLRSALLNSYDKMIPPVSNRTDVYESVDGGKTSLAGTEVGVNLRVFKVESVDTASSHLKLKVWFRMQWSDLRLAWDPAEFGGITQTQMRAAAITIDQDSDIWLPDIQPYNAGEAVASTLEPSLALVYSDGTVYWSRPGARRERS